MSTTTQKKGEIAMVKACDFYEEQKPWGEAGFYHAIDFAGKQFQLHETVVIAHRMLGPTNYVRGEISYIDRNYVNLLEDGKKSHMIFYDKIERVYY